MANILHEFMDRCSSGVTLANADLIDTKSMQGKPMLPGVSEPGEVEADGGSRRDPHGRCAVPVPVSDA